MVSLQISLPDRLKAIIDGKVAGGGFKDASEYLAALIHADARTSTQDRLDALLLEGIDSAEQHWDSESREAIRREAKRGSGR